MKVIFNAAKPNGSFGEHDVDTAIHTLFSRQMGSNVFESMCNPPGGDWSGISYWDFSDKQNIVGHLCQEFQKADDKRPDHVVQIHTKDNDVFLVIESKNNAKDLGEKIGTRLTDYVKALVKIPPTAYKNLNRIGKHLRGKNRLLRILMPIQEVHFVSNPWKK